MEQRRFILFLSLSMAVLLGWTTFVVPHFFPPPKKPAVAQQDKQPAADPADQAGEAEPAEVAAASPDGDEAAQPAAEAEPADAAAEDVEKPAAPLDAPTHPEKTIHLGTRDAQSDKYFLYVTLTTRGASVESIEFNDDRYKDLDDPKQPLMIVGKDPWSSVRTMATSVPHVDDQLFKATLQTVNWEVVPGSQSDSGVTFRIAAPDQSLLITKRYELRKPKLQGPNVRDLDPSGYELTLTQTIQNQTDDPQAVRYTLQGQARGCRSRTRKTRTSSATSAWASSTKTARELRRSPFPPRPPSRTPRKIRTSSGRNHSSSSASTCNISPP